MTADSADSVGLVRFGTSLHTDRCSCQNLHYGVPLGTSAHEAIEKGRRGSVGFFTPLDCSIHLRVCVPV